MPEIDLGLVVGPQGKQGEIGPAGAQGIQGLQGIPGEAGKSAYRAAKDGGFTGTEAEFNSIMAVINAHAGRHKKGGADEITPDMIGAAPAGYGLGGNSITPEDDDLNNATKNGWYLTSSGSKNVPTGVDYLGYGTTLVRNRNDDIIQEFTSVKATNITGSPYRLVRSKSNDSPDWSGWEWLNPPMLSGVEYRTTERWKGEPVYTVLVNAGKSTPGSSISCDTNYPVKEVLRQAATVGGYAVPFFHGGSATNSYSSYVTVHNQSGYIRIGCYTGSSVPSGDTMVQIWYTRRN